MTDTADTDDLRASPAALNWRRRPGRSALIVGAGIVFSVAAFFGESVSALAVQAFDRVTDAYLVMRIDQASMALTCF